MKKLSKYSRKRLAGILNSMKQRCYNPNSPSYNHYGGRGIRICVDWLLDSGSFYKWAIENGYTDNLSIDRINNTRANRFISFNEKTQTMAQWADEIGIYYPTLEQRINKLKWPLERALKP